ncbi:TadE/TadG family type IV pilus assembly protein [Bosea sp. NPDC055332]
MSISKRVGAKQRRSFTRDESGVAAIEFALIATGMFAMLSGAVDVTQAITIHRDLNRLTAEVAQVLAACPDLTCRELVIRSVNDRRANIAPQFPTMQISVAAFERISDKIDRMEGTMTELPADMNTKALAMLANGDKGVAVLATYTHQPIILGLADDWGFATKSFRAYSVNLSSRPGS